MNYGFTWNQPVTNVKTKQLSQVCLKTIKSTNLKVQTYIGFYFFGLNLTIISNLVQTFQEKEEVKEKVQTSVVWFEPQR